MKTFFYYQKWNARLKSSSYIEEQWRECHHEAYNIQQECTKILGYYVKTVTKNVLIFSMKCSKLIM